MKKIEGCIAATLAPFDTNGELNLSIIDKYVEHLQKERIKGIFVNGTTGEGLLLTVDEKKRLTEKWIQTAKDKLGEIIIQIGTSNLKDTQELARHAEDVGATAIAVMATTFFTPKTVDDLVEYVRQVSDSAPKTPLFYYHIPAWSHVPFLMEDFLTAAKLKIPTLVGLKFTSIDMFDLGRCLAMDTHQILYGGDDVLISALAMGAQAAVGSTYNFCGRLNGRLMEAFKKGDMETARKEQYRSQAMIKVFVKHGGHVGILKAFMRFLGVNLGPARSPISKITPSQEEDLRKDLKQIGFFDWCH